MKTELLKPWNSPKITPDQRFGRLVVISTHRTIKGHPRYFAKCQCDCGSDPIYVRLDQLIGHPKPPRTVTRSCGCRHKDRVTKHGLWGSPLLVVWQRMMDRCYKPQAAKYPIYGGRGIIVCERWHDPRNFVEDMSEGYRKGLQIDRINNSKGYYKENCHWATRIEQARNKRNNIFLTYNGKTRCMKEWAHIMNLNYGTLQERVRILGWPIEKALTTPPRKGNYRRKA